LAQLKAKSAPEFNSLDFMRQSTIYRWTPLTIATILVLMVTPVFWVTSLDITVASWFFDPTNPSDPWPQENALLWAFFYQASWLLSLGIVVLSVGLVVVARLGKIPAVWAPRGWSMLLVLVLGAGLLVNVAFKDNFGRYRPRQIEPFFGEQQYQMPLKPGVPGTGKSFPSGHPSPAFAMTILYFFWRGRRPKLAWIALLTSLGVGALMGVGRMAAGAHFLSDVIWTAYLMFATASLVYYGLLQVPEQDVRLEVGAPPGGMSTSQKIALTAVFALAILGSLFTKPVGHQSVYEMPAAELARLDSVELLYDKAEVQITEVSEAEPLRIEVTSRSFGAPGASILRDIQSSTDHLIFSVHHEGKFAEKGTVIHLSIPASARDKLEIVQGHL
jgi:lipid A 4'-phosphatase